MVLMRFRPGVEGDRIMFTGSNDGGEQLKSRERLSINCED